MNDVSIENDGVDAAELRGVERNKKPYSYVWYVVGLLFVVNLFNYMDRMALAILIPLIKDDLHLSDGQIGLLMGFAFFLFYAVCGIPIARWADRGNRRNIIAIALAAWSVMTALSGAAQSFWQLFLARVGIAAGEAGCLPPSQSMICDYVPLKRRSGIFAIHTLGIYAGIMLGMILAGWLGESIGWRWTFVVLGLPGIALALVVKYTLREPSRGILDPVNDDRDGASFRETIGTLRRCRTYRLLILFAVLNGFVQYGLNQWWPSFYVRVFSLNMSAVGLYLGMAIGVASAIGLLVGGLASNKAAQSDVRLPLIIGAAATGLALPAALAALFVPSVHASLLLVSLTALFWSVSNGPVVATAVSFVPARMRATAASLSIFATSVLGFGLGPFCVGFLSDILTPSFGVDGLRYALLAPVLVIPMLAVVLYAAAMAMPHESTPSGVRQKTNYPTASSMKGAVSK